MLAWGRIGKSPGRGNTARRSFAASLPGRWDRVGLTWKLGEELYRLSGAQLDDISILE